MNLSNIRARLAANVGALAQVVLAQPVGAADAVNTSNELWALLVDVFTAAKTFSLTAQDNPERPHAVWSLQGSRAFEHEGFGLLHTDLYVVRVRSDDLAVLVNKGDALRTAIETSSHAIEVTDVAMDFEPRTGTGRDDYVAAFEAVFTTVASSSQALPAAFLYDLGSTASESGYDNCIDQRMENRMALVLISDSDNIRALRDAVYADLLGYQETDNHSPLQYEGGQHIDTVGGLRVWREVFRDAEHITQS